MKIVLEPWNEKTIPKNRPLYVCERTRDYGNKWDSGLSCLVVCISKAGVNVVQPAVPVGSLRPIKYDELAEYWMEVDGQPCGR